MAAADNQKMPSKRVSYSDGQTAITDKSNARFNSSACDRISKSELCPCCQAPYWAAVLRYLAQLLLSSLCFGAMTMFFIFLIISIFRCDSYWFYFRIFLIGTLGYLIFVSVASVLSLSFLGLCEPAPSTRNTECITVATSTDCCTGTSSGHGQEAKIDLNCNQQPYEHPCSRQGQDPGKRIDRVLGSLCSPMPGSTAEQSHVTFPESNATRTKSRRNWQNVLNDPDPEGYFKSETHNSCPSPKPSCPQPKCKSRQTITRPCSNAEAPRTTQCCSEQCNEETVIPSCDPCLTHCRRRSTLPITIRNFKVLQDDF